MFVRVSLCEWVCVIVGVHMCECERMGVVFHYRQCQHAIRVTPV